MDSDSFSPEQDFIDVLKGLESNKAEYPPELLAARRKLFLEQLEERLPTQAAGELGETDQKLIEILRSLKTHEAGYPWGMLVRRRTLFKQQISQVVPDRIWHLLRSSVQNFMAGLVYPHRPVSIAFARAATLVLGIAMIAFVALGVYENPVQSNSPVPSQTRLFTATPGPIAVPSQASIVCANGDEPPLCIAMDLDKDQNVAYTGNGKARPAVAKDVSDGHMHSAAHLNDGLYGPAASWVSDSPNSWIKIDLGTPTAINTITFGRDRLGALNDGDPGRFVIAVATSDNIYADGNSSNDEREYVQVFDSQQSGFDGTISGAETVIAMFDLKRARFIKITFENARTAIDEVEAFVSRPAVADAEPTRKSSREESPFIAFTASPVATPIPSDTATAVPVDTLPPTETVTSVPTDPPPPTETPVPIDTPTPVDPTIPPEPNTPVPAPTETSSTSEEPINPVGEQTPSQ
jgi:hypothetical protein